MLSNTDRLIQYTIAYPFDEEYVIDFKYWGKDQITAVLSFDDGSADQELVLDSDYSLTDPDDTGTLTKLSDWDHDAVRLTIYRTVDLTQETDYRNGEAVDMDQIEQDFDLAAARDQQLEDTLSRSVVWPISDPEGINNELPIQSERSSKFAAWNADGGWIAAAGVSEVPVTDAWAAVLDDETIADGLTTMGFSAFAQTLIDDADAAAALTTLGVSAFAQTLLDDADASAALSTLGFSAFAKTLIDDANAAAILATLGLDAALSVTGALSAGTTVTGATGVIAGTGNTALMRKVVDIGDWNMDTAGSKNVAHGLSISKIRSIKALIRNDAGTIVMPLESAGKIYTTDATNITLMRQESLNPFDGVDYDATSYNRGWVVIEYVS